LINSYDFPQICLDEGQEKAFIEYVLRNPFVSTVDRFFTKLLSRIPEEIYGIYKKDIENNLVHT
jgi:hypothetical protein